MFAGFLGNQDRPHRPYAICVVFFYRFQVVGSESELFLFENKLPPSTPHPLLLSPHVKTMKE
jgi:hypothetical protein